MKTWKLLMMLFVLTITGVAFTGCSEDDDDAPQQKSSNLVGQWEQTNEAGTHIVLTFKSNETGSCTYNYVTGGNTTRLFTYFYDEEERYLLIESKEDTNLPGEYVVNISSSKLMLSGYSYYNGDVVYLFTRK